MINLNNFHIASFGIYKKCKIPKRKPDFISRNKKTNIVSSRYWYGKDTDGCYVIRLSDHWGTVASCRWLLNGSTENFPAPQCGKIYCANLEDLEAIEQEKWRLRQKELRKFRESNRPKYLS